LKAKRRQKEEAMYIEDTERSVTEEIEMLKVAFGGAQVLVRNESKESP